MKNIISALLLTAFGSTFAFADSRFSDIRAHAARVEKDNLEIARLLKAKQPDLTQVRDRLNATGQDLEKIKSLVADLDAQKPGLNGTAVEDFNLLRQKVQLLDIFHGAKQDLLKAENPSKNRSLLRAHAEGVARRAALLQQTAGRLEKN
jgi:hypothetical protein